MPLIIIIMSCLSNSAHTCHGNKVVSNLTWKQKNLFEKLFFIIFFLIKTVCIVILLHRLHTGYLILDRFFFFSFLSFVRWENYSVDHQQRIDYFVCTVEGKNAG